MKAYQNSQQKFKTDIKKKVLSACLPPTASSMYMHITVIPYPTF